ncbi:MAG: TonB-dependent receptor plug domain-containing protein [Methylophilaceae bacterium]
MNKHVKLIKLAISVCSLISLISLSTDCIAEELSEATIEENDATEKNTQAEKSTQKTQDKKVLGDAAAVLPEVKVSGGRIKDQRINKTQSITKITLEDLERTQASSVFDAVRGAPGVSVDGGPRLNGMSFSIRGYSEADVAISVDGVLKNYDKYRSKGTYIEPDLLKTIEIRRGPQISSNSGYLGGAIITTTKDAEDFLEPGKIYGGRAKFGYGSNNDEYLRSYLAYARPHEKVDVIYNYTSRESNDIVQGDGEKLDNSSGSTVSQLFKVTLFPIDSLRISTSIAKLVQGQTLQRYDTITESLFTTPYVLRAIDEETISQTITFNPDAQWIDLKVTLGTGHTKQDETVPFGWDGNKYTSNTYYCDGFIRRRISDNVASSATASATNCRGDRLDAFNFQNTNFDFANTAKIYQSDLTNLSLLTGLQYFRQKRELVRSFDNPASLAVSSAEEPASGIQTTRAFYIQPSLQISRLTITPGYRKDYVEIKAIEDSLEGLEAAGQADKINLKEETYNLGLAFDVIPKRLTLFTNYGQGFRPIPISTIFVNSGRVGGTLLSQSQCPPNNASCDDVYKTQRVENTEGGVTYTNPNFLNQQAQVTSKATFFHSHTSNTVLAIDNYAPIYGTEIRNGWEFENSLYYKNYYAQASYSRMSGKIIYLAQDASGPLYTAPGNALNLVIGARIGTKVDMNLNYRHIYDRIYLSSLAGANASYDTQPEYELFNAALRWSPDKHLAFRLIGENLTNKQYNLDGGFAGTLGLPATGRNIKFYTELIF